MYKVTKRDCPMFGIGPYVCEFICDTASDISTLPTSISEGTGGKTAYDNQKCASGSIANVAENGAESKQYMLNNQDIWCPYSVAAGSSGGGSSGSSITVDSALSETSESPVANKVITAALNNKADVTHSHSANEVGADASGSAASALEEAKAYTDSEIADLINGAPTTRDTLKEIADAMDENQTVVEALDTAIGTKANKTDIPTKVSQLENDSGYLTEHQDLSEYAKATDIPTELPANGGNADTVNGHSVEADVPADAVFTDTIPDLTPYALKSKYGDTTIDVGRLGGTTVGLRSTAEGSNTTASGSSSHAEGSNTPASGSSSHAEGYDTTASGYSSHAEGGIYSDNGETIDWIVTISDVDYTITGSTAYGINSHAEGTQSFAYGYSSHAEGFFTTAKGDTSHAEGYETTASGNYSHAEGSNRDSSDKAISDKTVTISDVVYTISGSTAYGINSHAEGTQSFAYGYSSHAEGYETTASSYGSHAEGCGAIASSYGSHAEGCGAIASGSYSHAEGFGTTSSGIHSHAEGTNTTANGQDSHAEGQSFKKISEVITDFSSSTEIDSIISAWQKNNFSLANGSASHVEGFSCLALSGGSHAEGSHTIASGSDSHAEGYFTTASGDMSHAEGSNTTASGDYSHTEGYITTATNHTSHAQGHYNASMTNGGTSNNTTGTAFVIGNGTQRDRLSNAFSVMYNGTVKAKSTITASTTADYAEFFEWLDGNPDSEDRVGYFVTIDGNKIRIANPDDEYILGVVSGEPFVLGNGDCDVWNDIFLRDEFRRTIYEPAPKMKEILDDDGNPTGEFEEIEGEFEGTRPKLNPEYDHTQRYISRFDRPEWAPIGMLGVLAVRHDGTAKVNGYVTVAEGGIATACEKNAENSYRVIKANTDSVVEIIFR